MTRSKVKKETNVIYFAKTEKGEKDKLQSFEEMNNKLWKNKGKFKSANQKYMS